MVYVQLLDMTEAEIRWVADHLGHSMDVHKKHYRLSDGTVEITKIAKILLANESGSLKTTNRNRKAEDIEITGIFTFLFSLVLLMS